MRNTPSRPSPCKGEGAKIRTRPPSSFSYSSLVLRAPSLTCTLSAAPPFESLFEDSGIAACVFVLRTLHKLAFLDGHSLCLRHMLRGFESSREQSSLLASAPREQKRPPLTRWTRFCTQVDFSLIFLNPVVQELEYVGWGVGGRYGGFAEIFVLDKVHPPCSIWNRTREVVSRALNTSGGV